MVDLKRNSKRIKIFLGDKDRKSISQMGKEVLSIWRIKKNFPIHYFGRLLYRKGVTNPEDFLDMKEYEDIILCKKHNQEEFVPLLSNKLIFSNFCERHSFPTPKMLGYNLKNEFFYNDEVLNINDEKNLFLFFEKVFDTSAHEKLFIKSLNGYGGKDVHLLSKSNLKKQLEPIAKRLLSHYFIHQTAIDQHPAINEIYPNSVNTLRLETYIANDGEIHILGTFMRFGSGGKVVDNVSSGGFFVPIDQQKGTLKEKATQGMIHGGKAFDQHPDTHFVFKDFEVPFFKEACDLARKLTQYIPNRLSGWDIAITLDGPVVVEGNNTPGITVGEVAYGGYVKHPLYKELIANTKY